jgi:hypothetical protein
MTQCLVCGLAPHEIIQFPALCQRLLRTKDTWCCECGRVYIGQTGHSVDIMLNEHRWHIQLEQLDKLVIAEHTIGQRHRIQFHNTSILAAEIRYLDRIVREAIEIELYPFSMNREGGFCFSKSWKPVIGCLKT